MNQRTLDGIWLAKIEREASVFLIAAGESLNGEQEMFEQVGQMFGSRVPFARRDRPDSGQTFTGMNKNEPNLGKIARVMLGSVDNQDSHLI